VVYRGFGPRGEAKETPLKPPKLVHHAAMMRQFKSALTGKSPAAPGPDEGVQLMELIAAIYKSAQTGKSVTIN
jgi:predicted dehydrogenase